MGNKENKILIFNCWWERTNYGAVLTAYALQTFISETLKYDNKLIYNPPQYNKYFKKFKAFDFFKDKYLKCTSEITTLKQLFDLNNNYNIFITGSDQVFRYPFLKDINNGYNQYLLDFASINSKKISIAASFGIKKIEFLSETTPLIREKMKRSLKTFDFISVREKDGVEICNDLFKIYAKCIIDPVFWLEPDHYNTISQESDFDCSDKIVSYFFHKTKKDKACFKNIEKKYGMKIIELYLSDRKIEDWLKAIKTSKLFITNSFHGVCFAILFNKPFICVVNSKSGISRYESLFEMLDIKNQCIYSLSEILEKDCIFKVNYNEVNKNINTEVKKGQNFLIEAIDSKIECSEQKIDNKIKILENQICELEDKLTLKKLFIKTLWEIWVNIFHCFPSIIQDIIRNIRRNVVKNRKK